MNDKGAQYEDRACAYLQGLGYTILKRNYSCKYGEIDLIARDGEYTVFVEVKYRKDQGYGFPIEAITRAKQGRLLKTALVYIEENGEDFYRFDAIVILGDCLEHLTNIDLSG